MDSREEVSELLALERKVDLVIPRGSNTLVKSILEQAEGKIPVLGHAEGICSVFVDQHADIEKAINIGTRAPTAVDHSSAHAVSTEMMC